MIKWRKIIVKQILKAIMLICQLSSWKKKGLLDIKLKNLKGRKLLILVGVRSVHVTKNQFCQG